MKSIPSLPEYYATKDGRIISFKLNRRKVLSQHHDKDGYRKVTLMRPNGSWSPYRVHILVLWAYIGKAPEGHICDHIDQNKDNNALSNLEWVTKKENLRRRVANYKGEWKTWGAWSREKVRGEKSGMAKLTARRVRSLRRLYATGKYTFSELARACNVSAPAVSAAIKGITWSHIT